MNGSSDDERDKRLDALLKGPMQTRSDGDSADCPGLRRLEAWRAGSLTGADEVRVSEHLAECDVCRDWLGIAAKERFRPAPATVWGDAVLVAAFVNTRGPLKPLLSMLTELEAEGATLVSGGGGVPWAAFDVGSGRSDGGPVDVAKLELCLRQLRKRVRPDASYGALVVVRRGSIGGPRGVRGDALHEAADQVSHIVPGRIRLTEEAAEYLQDESFRSGPVAGTTLRELAPGTRFWTTLASGARALVEGPAQWLRDASVGLRPARVERSSSVQQRVEASAPSVPVGPRLMRGDRLVIDFSIPQSGWVYLVRERALELDAPLGFDAVTSGEAPLAGSPEVVLDDRRGRERAFLLVSEVEVPGLEKALTAANQADAQTDEARLEAFAEVLRERHQLERFALLEAGAVEHVPYVQEVDDPDLNAAREALDRDEFVSAEASARRCLAGAGDDETFRDRARTTLGIALRKQGKWDEAIAELGAVEAAARARGDRAVAGTAARELGRALVDSDRVTEAWPYLDRALEDFRALGDRLEEARVNLHRAAAFWRQNCFAASAETFREVVGPARQSGELRLLGAGLEGLGQVLHEVGLFLDARQVFEEALSTFVLCRNRTGEMRIRGDLGQLAIDLHDAARAQREFRIQLLQAEEVGTANQCGMARINLCRALMALGEYEQARALVLRALDEVVIPSQRYHAVLRLGEIALEMGDTTEARRWIDLLDRHAQIPLEGMWRGPFARARLRILENSPNVEEEFVLGCEAIESIRGHLPQALRTEFLEVCTAFFDAWLAWLIDHNASTERLVAVSERYRARTFLDELSASHAEIHTEGMPRDAEMHFSHEVLVQSLPARSVVITMHSLPDRLLLCRIGPDRSAHCILPIGREELTQMSQEAFRFFRSSKSGTGLANTAIQKLSSVIMEPIYDWLKGPGQFDTVGFVPHGPLFGVPLHAVPVRHTSGADVLLMETHSIFYSPSLASTVRWLCQGQSTGAGILAMAAPASCLHHAEEEARRAYARVGGGWLLVAESCTPTAFSEKAGAARYIHLALHATQATDTKPAQLEFPTPPSHRATRESDGNAAPNRAIIQMDSEWVRRHRLDADLVVLSACESGIGRQNASGEGPDLLSWAFLSSGARSVISSAWRVDDEATSILMDELYAQLMKGASRAEALARAQRKMMRTAYDGINSLRNAGEIQSDDLGTLHPYYWAAFFLTGDWR